MIGRAPCAAQMGQAEAVGLAVGVVVAAAGLDGVGSGVGAPLQHAERGVRTGELTHRARAHGPGAGAVECPDGSSKPFELLISVSDGLDRYRLLNARSVH